MVCDQRSVEFEVQKRPGSLAHVHTTASLRVHMRSFIIARPSRIRRTAEVGTSLHVFLLDGE